jgi:Transposase DDE domain
VGGKPDYYLLRVQRVVLTSAKGKPALDQAVIPPTTNEMGAFAALFGTLVKVHGTLFEIATVDAGMTSLDNANLVEQADKAYVMALKDNQPGLYAEAQRVLLPLGAQPPEAQTPWERRGAKRVRRSLFRSEQVAGYEGWTHLRQVWLVRQETREPGGTVHIEDRYFATNLRWGRLQPAQILLVVRNHWGIENDCFWSLDAQFGEDDHPWVTTGHALLVLGVLRLMAYNLLQRARKGHLRRRLGARRFTDPPTWKQLFRWVQQALRLPLDPPAGPMPAD